MIDLSGKNCLVIDNGLFICAAQKLAEKFGQVYYWTPWESAFPKSNDMLIGKGLPGIIRINHLWDFVDKADVVVFPDVYFGDLQDELRDREIPVWGCFRGEELELNREGAKKLFKKIGLPVGDWASVTGIQDLRKYLQDHEDVWVKVSATRGDFETFHSIKYSQVEPKVDELESILGAKKNIQKFVVEHSIPAQVEIGYDGFTVDGEWPATAIQAYEIKDRGMVGVVKPYDQLCEPVKWVNRKLSEVLKNYGYRGFFSTELRVTEEGVPYLIDPCCRAGSPSVEMMLEMFSNLPEIIWEAAHGRMLDPIATASYGCEIMIHSTWADQHWQPIDFPQEIERWIKLRNLTRINGRNYVVPQRVGLPEIGAVVGLGETLEDAIEQAKEYCEQIEGYYLEFKTDCIEDAMSQIKAGEKLGISFQAEPQRQKQNA